MTRILHTGDLHLGSFPGPERDGRNVRFDIMCDLLGQVVDRAAERDVDLAILAGDLWHQAKVWSDRGLREQAVVLDFVTRLAALCPVLVMRGTPNHDSAEQFRALESSLARVGTKFPTWVVTRPGCGLYQDRRGTFLNIVCLPGYDREAYAEVTAPYVDAYQSEAAAATVAINNAIVEYRGACVDGFRSVLVGHFTTQGCDMESGQTAFFSETEPVVVPQVVSQAGFDLVCFNHIHRRQEIKGCERAFYSGAITQLNFNDEGQERGIYFHELRDDGTLASEFVELSGTRFLTVWLNEAQVRALVDGDDVPSLRAPEIRDKIVRVKYNCSDATNREFRHADAERRLYDAGAFHVAEVSPVSVSSTVGGVAMNVDVTPETALTDYLLSAGEDAAETQALVDLARPLIETVDASASTERRTGLFMPVSISVRNYRNYVEQSFDYGNVRFCTINGENGVGKSSLFMDAVVDCLYEEPREGDLTGWIRNDPKAKSGRIEFVFTLGDEKFRVERTRAKSGKTTLTLAVEEGDGSWRDMSCARTRDTQQRIVDLVGMDCRTFKSCALVMQDQYGLFLCADKAERMGILGSILGLGFYDDLEAAADRARADDGREVRSLTESAEKLRAKLPDVEALEREIATSERRVSDMDAELARSRVEESRLRSEVESARSAGERASELEGEIDRRERRLADARAELDRARADATRLTEVTARAGEIRAGVAELGAAEATRDARAMDVARVDALARQVESARAALAREELDASRAVDAEFAASARLDSLRAELSMVDADDVERRVALLVAANDAYRELVDVARPRNWEAERALRSAESERERAEAAFAADVGRLDAEVASLDEQAALLDSDTGCVDAARAECVFLRAARAARERAGELRAARARMESERAAAAAVEEERLSGLRARVDASLDDRILAARARYDELFPVVAEREALDKLRGDVDAAEAAVEDVRRRRVDVESRRERARADLDALSGVADDDGRVRAELGAAEAAVDALRHWADDERTLNVAEARVDAVARDVARLEREVDEAGREIERLRGELVAARGRAAGLDEASAELSRLLDVARVTQSGRDEQAEALGGMRRELRSVRDAVAEAEELEASARTLRVRADRYARLRDAFSRDGIRHRVVKSVLPGLESTASSILGQMSGGRMSVELVTERALKSNARREVSTLDVIIHDDVTGSLPYMSRSGGERVKASLSVILALAEMKGSQAGIQLGFLGIDEPPFLDAQGAQAYCDALEAIQRRYAGMKIMAISHDESMKARFPQSVTVVKTASGSRLETTI